MTIDMVQADVKVGKTPNKANTSKPTMVVRDVTMRFGSVTALNDFSAEFPHGIVGLLGPNGAGKSTLIKSALGLLRPGSGTIRIKGMDPSKDMMAVRDAIGYMPEHDCLIPTKNAVQLVSYLGQLSGMTSKDSKRRCHEVLDFVNIGEERYREISSYSTGMLQRIKLAQAIVHDPEILFLDEPTNGMDPQGRDDMLDLISKIARSGKSVLLSSHILDEVEQIADHAIIISNGALIKEGDIRSLLLGEEGLYRVISRGEKEALATFQKGLKGLGKIHTCETMEGSMTLVIKLEGSPSDSGLFHLAAEAGIQIRALKPEKLSLEDVFVNAFEGSEKNGN